MKKKYCLIALAVVVVLGSLFTALASNMLFDDLFNMAVPFANHTLFVSLPATTVAVFFALLVFYIFRMYRHPKCAKRITKTYLIIAAVLGCIGFIFSIVGGLKVYGTLFGRHPFPGYFIIFILLNLLISGGAAIGWVILPKKLKDDEDKVKVRPLYVLKTFGWFLFICMMFNRFGMFLGMPAYIYLRNLYLTFPFYIYLLMPVFLGVLIAMKNFELLDRKKLFLMGLIALGVNVVLFAYIALMGINNTAFVSSLSQCMPLERMASKPIEILIHFLTYTGVGVAVLVLNKKPKEKAGE